MVHQIYPAPVALLATGIQRDAADACAWLKIFPAIRALLDLRRFLPWLWCGLLRNQMKSIREPLYESLPTRAAGGATFNFSGGACGQLVAPPAIHTNARPGP